MSTLNVAKVAVLAALFSSAAACAQPAADDAEAVSIDDIGQTSAALTTCDPVLKGAAITKQIVSVDEPTTLTLEITTLSTKPYRLQTTGLTYPAGMYQLASSTSCTDSGADWRCRHLTVLQVTTATSGTGAYAQNLYWAPDMGSGCFNWSAKRIDFSVTTESFGTYTVDVTPEAVIYQAAYYGGGAQPLEEGWYNVNDLMIGNDTLSSLKVKAGWKVTLFSAMNWSGNSKTFTADTSYVGNDWNDVASSIHVERAY